MKGFILMESLISAALIAAVSVFLFGLLNFCAVNSERVARYSRNIIEAGNSMESLRTVPFSMLSGSGNVIINDIDPDTKSIEVNTGSFSLYTVRSRF